jgi:hypothetical protein
MIPIIRVGILFCILIEIGNDISLIGANLDIIGIETEDSRGSNGVH